MNEGQLELHLALLQAEQFETARYLAGRRQIASELKQRVKWTYRLRLTKFLARIGGVVAANEIIGFGVSVIEGWTWWQTARKIAAWKKRGLKVIGVVGSYGKSSVKHNLYDSLRKSYRVVVTPESYNTVFGIAKCVKWEVDEKTQIFVAEMGAYHIGDITRLLRMVQPDIGVLTGIARQHLERFGSFENIIQAKSEIAHYMKEHGGWLVANQSDREVANSCKQIGGQIKWYQGEDRQAINAAGAFAVARLLGVTQKQLDKVKLQPVKNRFELTQTRYGMEVIDDSYSSNDKGFVDAVSRLARHSDRARILVTPGLVELGNESNKIHEELGRQLVHKVDCVMLVGHNARTASLERGIAGKVQCLYIKKTLDFVQAVAGLKLKKKPLVLLENDVPENY